MTCVTRIVHHNDAETASIVLGRDGLGDGGIDGLGVAGDGGTKELPGYIEEGHVPAGAGFLAVGYWLGGKIGIIIVLVFFVFQWWYDND